MSGESSHNRSIQKHEHGGRSGQIKREDADEETPYNCNEGLDYDVVQDYDDEVSEEEWGDGDEVPSYNDDEWGEGDEAPPYNDEEWEMPMMCPPTTMNSGEMRPTLTKRCGSTCL